MSPKACLSFKVKQFDRLLARQYDSAFAISCLKCTQFSLMTHIKNYGPIVLKELDQKMAIELPTMTRNIQVLKKIGWVKLSIGNDVRSRLVAITKKGVPAQKRAPFFGNTSKNRLSIS